MLRITALSLLLGALAAAVSLTLFFAPPEIDLPVPAISLNAATTRVISGKGIPSDGQLQLELNKAGFGVVNLLNTPVDAQAYPYLHLALQDSSKDLRVRITWLNDQDTQGLHAYLPESKLRESQWLATHELRGWTGNIRAVSLMVRGRAGEKVSITDFAIFPASLLHQLQAIYSDLASFVPWSRGAMNSRTGATNVSSFYPVPLVISFFTLSLLGYGLLLLLLRARLRFSWRVVALIFLSCWIALDAFWQKSLLHQLADSYRTFAGKTSPEKLAVGPDAKLYNFAAQVKPLLHPGNARVFIGANEEYEGQRGGYYLYPFNVFWPEPGREFPRRDQLRSGDYVVLLNPSTMSYRRAGKLLLIPLRNPLRADLVFTDDTGTVLRLN